MSDNFYIKSEGTNPCCGMLNMKCSPRECGSDVLAFVGDGVFGVLVREYLVCQSRAHANELHNRATAMVRCEAQAEYMNSLLPLLTEEEEGVFRRGRNYHSSHSPRRSTAAYRAATGLEALFGYLYLCGRNERIRELFAICTEVYEGQFISKNSETEI